MTPRCRCGLPVRDPRRRLAVLQWMRDHGYGATT